MKLTFVICLLTFLQVSAASYAQKITLNVKNEPFDRLLDNLEQQSGYHFLYDDQLIHQGNPVTLDVKQAPLTNVLVDCFSGQPFTYVIKNNNVIVTARPKEPVQKPVSQSIISGVVTDEQNQAVPGVSVTIKGTNFGVTTDINGKYSITVPNADAVLVFSSIGYNTREIPINGRTSISVGLVAKANSLNDVVVVGYGTQKKSTVTGAIFLG